MPPLLKLILIRLGLGILTLFLVSVVVFAATQALPGDTGPRHPRQGGGQQGRVRGPARSSSASTGPSHKQYFSWLGGVVSGDLGNSLAGRASRSPSCSDGASSTPPSWCSSRP